MSAEIIQASVESREYLIPCCNAPMEAWRRYRWRHVWAVGRWTTLKIMFLGGSQRRVALSCGPVRALLRIHGLESTLMQHCAHGSAPVGALPWAQHALCAADWLNFMLICNTADGLLDYAKVVAYLATHSQTNTYQSPQNRWHSSSHSPRRIVCHVGL